jgi:predicted metal-binding membrane protein
VCWVVALAAQLTGRAGLLHHDALIEGDVPLGVGLLISVAAWQVMIGAMMLPSSVPMLRLFAATTPHANRAHSIGAFIGGYAAVWTAFGAAAFGFDTAVHHVVDATPWLTRHPWLIAGLTLAAAGAFQFTKVKDRCLEQCRHPAAYLLRHYRRGTAEAFRLGWGHGLFCLGCCWALMLLMFAAGVANLVWMAALAGLMAYEKVGRRRRQLTPVAGVVLLGLAALVLLHPTWLPDAASSLG